MKKRDVVTASDFAPFHFCQRCGLYHHPNWHNGAWRQRIGDAISASRAASDDAREHALRDLVATYEAKDLMQTQLPSLPAVAP